MYVYSPTRDGDTPGRRWPGSRACWCRDFYAAYDSLDCPQQKCLIHLIRDFNDDLLNNPFDEELKQLAARSGPAPGGRRDDRPVRPEEVPPAQAQEDVDRFFPRSRRRPTGRSWPGTTSSGC